MIERFLYDSVGFIILIILLVVMNFIVNIIFKVIEKPCFYNSLGSRILTAISVFVIPCIILFILLSIANNIMAKADILINAKKNEYIIRNEYPEYLKNENNIEKFEINSTKKDAIEKVIEEYKKDSKDIKLLEEQIDLFNEYFDGDITLKKVLEAKKDVSSTSTFYKITLRAIEEKPDNPNERLKELLEDKKSKDEK
ncbi:MAG: hypothetical protein Q4B52_03740 [Tissierellia bacterium]|nr:hypothetical protein [Tissierellia bacterium]